MFRGDGELAVDRQDQQRIESSCANQFRDICHVHKKEGLEKLRDDLVCADEQYHFPFRPIPDVINVPEDDTKKHDLPAKPQNLHNHPQEEIRLETQLPNE